MMICTGQAIWSRISQKRLEVESRLQWSTYRKCYMVYQMVTCPVTSRDHKRSRSWPRYIWSRISRKRLEIEARFQWSSAACWPNSPLIGRHGKWRRPSCKFYSSCNSVSCRLSRMLHAVNCSWQQVATSTCKFCDGGFRLQAAVNFCSDCTKTLNFLLCSSRASVQQCREGGSEQW